MSMLHSFDWVLPICLLVFLPKRIGFFLLVLETLVHRWYPLGMSLSGKTFTQQNQYISPAEIGSWINWSLACHPKSKHNVKESFTLRVLRNSVWYGFPKITQLWLLSRWLGCQFSHLFMTKRVIAPKPDWGSPASDLSRSGSSSHWLSFFFYGANTQMTATNHPHTDVTRKVAEEQEVQWNLHNKQQRRKQRWRSEHEEFEGNEGHQEGTKKERISWGDKSWRGERPQPSRMVRAKMAWEWLRVGWALAHNAQSLFSPWAMVWPQERLLLVQYLQSWSWPNWWLWRRAQGIKAAQQVL